MANWTTLKAAIANVIKTNGNQEITGQLLQNTLSSIISSVGENATFAGIATPTTNPGAPDGPVFYLAAEAGVYSNFNGIELTEGEAVIFEWDNGTWSKRVTGFVTQEEFTQLESKMGALLDGSTDETIYVDLSTYKGEKCCLGGRGWYYENSLKCEHKAIPLGASDYELIITTGNFAYIGFVTDAYSAPYSSGDSVPYVQGTSRIGIEAGVEEKIKVPFSAKYIVFTTIDGAGIKVQYQEIALITSEGIRKEFKNLQSELNDLNDLISGLDEDFTVDLSTVESQKCALGSESFGWYNQGGINCSHKAVKLKVGYDKVSIITKNFAYIGFVTDKYAPPYSSGNPVPYVQGTSRIGIEAGVEKVLDIPYGTAYLILTTRDGAGNDIDYSSVILTSEGLGIQFYGLKNNVQHIEARLATIERRDTNTPKGIFGIMCYNVGGWYNGSGSSIPSESNGLYLPLQQNILQRYNPDVILIQEYRDTVVQGGINAQELLNGYNCYNTSGNTSYDGKCIASKSVLSDVEVGVYAHKDGLNRNYIKGYMHCNGRRVLFVSTHLSTNLDIAKLEVDELIDLIREEEYVVLGMDSNINALSEEGAAILKKFTDAGFHYLNKNVVTYPKSDLGIDNIVVTANIVARSVYADTQKSVLGDDADHYPLLTYLEIF